MGAYVDEISKVLPDHTYLSILDIKTTGKVKEVVLTGETASSSKLIELIESSKILQNAAPRGPTSRGSTPGSERFVIGAEARPRTPPEPQPLPAAPAKAAPAPGGAPVVPQGANAAVPQGANAVPATPAKPGSGGFGPFPKQ
jgi:hypothetical protein